MDGMLTAIHNLKKAKEKKGDSVNPAKLVNEILYTRTAHGL